MDIIASDPSFRESIFTFPIGQGIERPVDQVLSQWRPDPGERQNREAEGR
jgi:hypothetical protein